ncbi:ROK family protein [Streptomyces asoensis]|uniref:ROK family protein n=1 Tax=Streptomyces asoensis TaxID=249586 RepID=A0A6M4WHN4_9ACTN|nr:ROK family protein [Streptomyces asoensis]QJS99678.1 ROK family protein [Streptomyces asoensis]
MNLVNVQGSGEIVINPASRRDPVSAALERADPTGSWRDWWYRASGVPVRLSEGVPSTVAMPVHRFSPLEGEAGPDPLLGINVGGHYLRLVRVCGGTVVGSRETRLGTGQGSALSGISLRSFVELLTGDELSHGVRGVGIAWSAPRTSIGLRAMSILTEGGGEVFDLLDAGELDSALTKALGCPVHSWNDGEGVAAAEALARPPGEGRSLLALKLGTSFASGLALGTHQVSALPMQLAKCLPASPPPECLAHPMTGLHGTARDALGAASVTEAYRRLADLPQADYKDYCLAAVRRHPVAMRLARSAARTVAELAHLVSTLWSPADLVLSGRNLRQLPYRQMFTGLVRHELALLPSGVTLVDPAGDVSLSAALGAAALSRAQT